MQGIFSGSRVIISSVMCTFGRALRMVVITFCTFSLRPRQTMLLSAISLAGMGVAMWRGVAEDPSHHPVTVEALFPDERSSQGRERWDVSKSIDQVLRERAEREGDKTK